MRALTIKISLKSDALIGSGEGFGAIIDTDIVFDKVGIPYIPARRIKGCLRDSAREICVMFESAGIDSFLDLRRDEKNEKEYKIVNDVFGRAGQEKPSPVFFSRLTIEAYNVNRKWLEYLLNEYKELVSAQSVLSAFTEIRQQTAINKDGVAKEHSLRTVRVIQKGVKFEGEIQVDDDNAVELLSLACLNLKSVGTKRNRGFGEVLCELFEGDREHTVIDRLEALCIN
jgi:CRISPR-associated protein Csx10